MNKRVLKAVMAILILAALAPQVRGLSIGGDLIPSGTNEWMSREVRLYQNGSQISSQIVGMSYQFNSLSAGSYEVALMNLNNWKRDSVFVTLVDTSCLDVNFVYSSNGEINGNNVNNVTDAFYILRYFHGEVSIPYYASLIGDYNHNQSFDGIDVSYLLRCLKRLQSSYFNLNENDMVARAHFYLSQPQDSIIIIPQPLFVDRGDTFNLNIYYTSNDSIPDFVIPIVLPEGFNQAGNVIFSLPSPWDETWWVTYLDIPATGQKTITISGLFDSGGARNTPLPPSGSRQLIASVPIAISSELEYGQYYFVVGTDSIQKFPIFGTMEATGDRLYNTCSYSLNVLVPYGYAEGVVTDSSTGYPIAGVTIFTNDCFTNTDEYGHYILQLPLGDNNLTFQKSGYQTLNITNVNIQSVDTTMANAIMSPQPRDLVVSLWGEGIARPGFNKSYRCEFSNLGISQAQNSILTMILPVGVTYLSSIPEGLRNGDTIVWDLGDISPGSGSFVSVNINIPVSVLNGTVLAAFASILTSDPESFLANNHDSETEIVVNSWDPNDKFADPLGTGSAKYIKSSENIKYTIFFENEGTGDAVNIVIIDTLDPALDWNTLKFGPVSHPSSCSSYFDRQTGVLTWTCDSIMLPPNTIPPEGEGFVTFEIYPSPVVASGASIANRAGIKFDFNPWMYAPMTGEYLIRTIDDTAPYTSITALPAEISSDTFRVFWTGQDPAPGSGLKAIEIYVSIDSGEYSLWEYSEYSDTSDLFTGQDGHCYYFYSLGIDSAGNIEQIPQTYDAFTCLSLGQCDYLIGDISGDGQRLGGDVTYGVRFFKGIGTAPRDSCYMDSTHTYLYVAADCNGNCEFRGSDITRLVSYFKGIASLSCCHFFPTALPPLLKGQKLIVNTEN